MCDSSRKYWISRREPRVLKIWSRMLGTNLIRQTFSTILNSRAALDRLILDTLAIGLDVPYTLRHGRMELLHLPTELFRTILQQVVIRLGLCEAISLRLVWSIFVSCRVALSSRLTYVELFDDEIPDAIVKARLLKLFAEHLRTEIGQPLLSKDLGERILADKTMAYILPTTVNRTVEILLREKNLRMETNVSVSGVPTCTLWLDF